MRSGSAQWDLSFPDCDHGKPKTAATLTNRQRTGRRRAAQCGPKQNCGARLSSQSGACWRLSGRSNSQARGPVHCAFTCIQAPGSMDKSSLEDEILATARASGKSTRQSCHPQETSGEILDHGDLRKGQCVCTAMGGLGKENVLLGYY